MPSVVRRAIVLAALSALIVLLVGAAQAGATVQRSEGPFSFPVTNPCNGETGTLSGTRTMSTLVNDTPNQFLFQSTTQTDETCTPDNPASPSATGHGVSHDTFIDNHAGGLPLSGTTVQTDVATDVFLAPGITVMIHDTAHTAMVDGTPVVTVDRPVLVCRGQ